MKHSGRNADMFGVYALFRCPVSQKVYFASTMNPCPGCNENLEADSAWDVEVHPDVEKIWEQAATIPDEKERRRKLRKLVGTP